MRGGFVALARTFGADGARVTAPDEIGPALTKAWNAPTPFVLDVICGYTFPYPDYAAALANLDARIPS